MRLMRLSRAIAIGLLVSLAITACVPSSVRTPPAENADAQHAKSLAEQGQFDQAAQAYLSLAGQSSDYRDHYRLLAAEAWRQENQLTRAAPILKQIDPQQLQGDEPLRLNLLLIELALDQQDANTALQLSAQPSPTTSPDLQLRALELRARALAATGDDWGAARTRVQMDAQLTGFDKSQNDKQILSLLGKVGVASLKQRTAAMKPDDNMLTWANEALTQLGVAVASPQPSLQQPVGTLLPGADATVREGYKVPAQIALILPSDGNFGPASMPIREGFFAGYLDAGHNHAPRPSVRVYNTHGTADGAVKAYLQAVTDGAQLVVGPLTRPEVSAVLAQPKLPASLLALNQPDDKQLPASNVSEFGLLPETEGAQVADHMAERGLHHVYILISNDDFAQRAANAFKAEWTSRSGQADSMTTLTSFSANGLSGLNLANAGSDAGVFISMRPNQARLLVPQLLIANAHLPVFATSHVYGGTDDATDDNDLDGVEFCDAPWLFNAQPGLPNRDDIATQLPAAQGSAARLFAFGMDAWNLAPYLDWLRAHPGSYLPGASGQLAADQFGHIRRVLIWAKFQDGLARPLTGSLQTDDVPASSGSAAAPASAASIADPTPNPG